jgi:hypothetical protein
MTSARRFAIALPRFGRGAIAPPHDRHRCRTPQNTTGQAAEAAAPRLEAVMGKAIPRQHPAVVLRSHYRRLRALLAITMIVLVGVAAGVAIVATDEDGDTIAASATQASAPGPAGNTRYDGGPEEGTRGGVPVQPPSVRYDGGPEEGSRATLSSGPGSNAAPGTRYDGGPEEGSRGSGR